eukprot:3723928-Rhodomonas_salina.2
MPDMHSVCVGRQDLGQDGERKRLIPLWVVVLFHSRCPPSPPPAPVSRLFARSLRSSCGEFFERRGQ